MHSCLVTVLMTSALLLLQGSPGFAQDESGVVLVPASPSAKAPAPGAAARELIRLAESPVPTGGRVLRWDPRNAVAWLCARPSAAPDVEKARAQAAKLLGADEPGRLSAVSLSALAPAASSSWTPFAPDTTLGRAIAAGTLDVVLFSDLGALARSCRSLAERDKLSLDLRADIGLMRLGDGRLEHRLWLTDVPARMLWTGRSFADTWLDALSETRRALALYAKLKAACEAAIGGPVAVRGHALAHPRLPPRGEWGYQEMVAEGVTSEAKVRFHLLQEVPLGDTLIQVPLPVGTDPLGQGAGGTPILTRPAAGHQVGYLIERPDRAEWLTARMAQDRGWELEAIDERVARDAPRIPLRGYLLAMPGLEGQAVLAIGRYASALALYPGALKRVADGAFAKATRVRAYSATPHALVITTLDVAPDRMQGLREAAARAEIQVMKQQPAALGLELFVDLPAEASGAVYYAPLANPNAAPSAVPK